mmetsp:Transcript_35324/g.40105  ORF Transcript_35324/g.40105 Transcript_35324/m.40105 type:complete len:483 (+) Transcript_35324:126-1574(+)
MEPIPAGNAVISDQSLVEIVKLFVCPSHDERDLEGYDIQTRTLGCTECIRESEMKVRLSSHQRDRVEIMKELLVSEYCSSHDGKVVQFYCYNHEKGVCVSCVPLCNRGGHKFEELDVLYHTSKDQLIEASDICNTQHSQLSLLDSLYGGFLDEEITRVYQRIEKDRVVISNEESIIPEVKTRVEALFCQSLYPVEKRRAAIEEGLEHHDVWSRAKLVRFCQEQDLGNTLKLLKDLKENPSQVMMRVTKMNDYNISGDVINALRKDKQQPTGYTSGKSEREAGDSNKKSGKIAEREEPISSLANRGNSGESVVYNNQGPNLSKMGSYDEAISCYDKATKLDPNDSIAYFNKGCALSQSGKHNEAIGCFEKAIRLNPKCSAAYTGKGMALSDLGQYQQAIANYEEAIELDPNDSITYNNKGITHSKQGNFKAAVTSYNRALNINPNDSTTLTNKGNLTHTPQTHKTLTLRDCISRECFISVGGL